MKLIGNLKKQVEETKNKEEAKEVIEKAGMELTEEELDLVVGGYPELVRLASPAVVYGRKHNKTV